MFIIKNLRKYISIFLMATMIFNIIAPFFEQKLQAATDVESNKPQVIKGVIYFNTTSTKATSSIKYRTIGWTIHRQPVNSGNPTQAGIPYAQVFLEQVKEDDLGVQVTTYFEVSKDEINNACNSKTAEGFSLIQSNDLIYMSAIFEVRKYDANGNYTILGLKQYDSLQGIKGAQSWAKPSDFDQYFNIEVRFDSSEDHTVTKEIILNGSHIPALSQNIGNFGSGKKAAVNYDKTFTYNNVTYELERIYYKKEKDLVKENNDYEYTETTSAFNCKIPVHMGGVKVYGEYKSTSKPKVTIRHINTNTNQILDETVTEITSGASITEAAKEIPKMVFVSSNYSRNGGTTWTNRTIDKTISLSNIKDNVIINFYYAGLDELTAALTLRASPDIIETGTTATVAFTLDASGSICDKRTSIVKYEFWLSDTSTFTESPQYTETSSIKVAMKTGVQPSKTYYGKVRVTDGLGNKAEAEAQVTIGEFTPEPEIVVEGDLKIILNDGYTNRNIISFEESWLSAIPHRLGGHTYFMEVRVPSSYRNNDGAWDDMTFEISLDASRSVSTNGIGTYYFLPPYPDKPTSSAPGASWNGQILEASAATTNVFTHTMEYSPDDAYNGRPYYNDFGDGYVYDQFFLMLRDSKKTEREAYVTVSYLAYKYVFDKLDPGVELAINRTDFSYAETGYLTPKIIQNSETYEVTSTRWEIYTQPGITVENGSGLIPSEYIMYLPEGNYGARQYITYEDADGYYHEKYAQVSFKVVPLREPDVTIASDKERYIAPTAGYFTVEYISEIGKTFLISDHEYALKDYAGNVIESGRGTFPEELFYDVDTGAGVYTAEQTIYWYENGQMKSKTASCKYMVISPVPVADFHVSMKTSTSDTWLRIDEQKDTGKQYRQIRIDLTPSVELNKLFENPYEIQFGSSNTQIQITQLTGNVSTIRTPNSGDISISGDTATIKGKQYIDIRFDTYGTYRVSVRVANAHYTSAWVIKDITIREDLPPVIKSMTITGATTDPDTGGQVVYRRDDLHAVYGLDIAAVSQDDDELDYGSAKLSMQYDYTADGDVTNDGEYSKMYMMPNSNYLLDCFSSATKNTQMTSFTFDMFNSSYPILGKVRFEYSISKKPVIPYFTGGTMPAVNIPTATSANISEYSKTVTVDNLPGTILVSLGKDTILEIVIIMDDDELHFDLDALIATYKDTAVIYMLYRDGTRVRVN